MDKILNIEYSSSLSDLCEINSSFDKGILRICYTGENRNGSNISKKAIQKSLKTIYNCPVVCNYIRETNSLGGHDVEIVADESGNARIVNVTQPVGVIPESAKVWFDEYEEADGTVNEYLYAEVLLWKRQEAYEKIKSDGIEAHSMEITVNDGELKDGIYYINNFEFTAFALIGVEPCFESSALQVFNKETFREEFSMMMKELKSYLEDVSPSKEGDDIQTKNMMKLEKGGNEALEDKINLAKEYGIDIDSLDFSLEDFDIEELKEKFEAIKESSSPREDNGAPSESFELTSEILEEIQRELRSVKIEREWGECERYWYVDCDFDTKEVYCWDTSDWLLYGFAYQMNGDNVVIDYESKKRKKYSVVDFDEGEQPSPFGKIFNIIESKLHENINAVSELESIKPELEELRQYKENEELVKERQAKMELMSQFDDLNGDAAFELLKEECMNYDIETIEEKCYAIRGKKAFVAKSAAKSNPKLPIIETPLPQGSGSLEGYSGFEEADEPYGGIFKKYNKK